MDQRETPRPDNAPRLGAALDRVERIYLRVLRAAILVLASLLLAYAAWLGLSSVYEISRSTSSVEEKIATVSADEIIAAQATTTPKQGPASQSKIDPQQSAFYSSFVNKYYDLFKRRFEPYKQPDDKSLTRDEFDDTFINTPQRLASIADGKLDFESDKTDLNSLLAVLTEASNKPRTKQRLQQYKSAKKVQVSRQVQRTRTSVRGGWDRYSTDCPDWYEEPMGCADTHVVETPYTETVTSMEFPAGTQSHSQLFRAFQDRYLSLLHQRREANAESAANERAQIEAGHLEGNAQLLTMLQILGGFLVLMFFFLLIAIERHQRRLARDYPGTDGIGPSAMSDPA